MLSVDDLCKPLIQRSKVNHETYKLIYNECIEHIKRKHEVGCTITLYDVPSFVLTRPIYTHAHAIRYVTEKLRKGKFDVTPDGSVLHIDWEDRLKEAYRKRAKKLRPPPPPPPAPPSKKKAPAKVEPLSVRLQRLLNN
jgi:hypothetical protein